MKDDALPLHARGAELDHVRKLFVEGVRKPDVPHNPVLEEGERADALGPVNDLVGNDEVHGLDLLAEGPDGGEGDDAADADGPQSGDVGARWHLMRGDLVVDAVASEEGYGDAIVPGNEDGRRGEAPRRGRVDRGYGLKAGDAAEASPAYYGDVDGFCRRELDHMCCKLRASEDQ